MSASLVLPAFAAIKAHVRPSGVLVAELRRPQRLNALSEQMGEELLDLLEIADRPEVASQVRAVVLAGAQSPRFRGGQRVFSAGRDLIRSKEHKDEEERKYYMSIALDTVLRLRDAKVPTVAAVSGVALGWGLELALACDLRYTHREAILGLPETSLGIFPGAAGAVMLPRLVPQAVAKEIIFTARKYSGEEAKALGLVNGIAEDPYEKAIGVAEEIAKNAPLGLRGAKEVMNTSADGNFAGGLELSRVLRPQLTTTADHQEALAAFAEKRTPTFKGE